MVGEVKALELPQTFEPRATARARRKVRPILPAAISKVLLEKQRKMSVEDDRSIDANFLAGSTGNSSSWEFGGSCQRGSGNHLYRFSR